MQTGKHRPGGDQDRRLHVLERLLALETTDLKSALDQAARQLVESLDTDKIDIFLHEPAEEMLVAVGTDDSPMARRQQQLGLDRLALSGGGTTVRVFRTGRSTLSRHLDQEPEELPEIVHGLGVRSQLAVPMVIAGERRGVLVAYSATPECFSERDLEFVETVARWVGLVGYRAAYVERRTREAAEAGRQRSAEQTIEMLTPRQREVAVLIARGLTNAEIARQLVLAPGTVANHVEQILRRLGFKSRTQIGIWAVERGLLRPDVGSAGRDA